MNIKVNKDEIINFVIESTDEDNLIIATFIAGMQAKKNVSQYHSDDDKNPQNRLKAVQRST